MEVDKEKIKQRFSEINESLKEIERLTSLEEKEFWSKKENMAAVKYYLLQAIEAVGGICVIFQDSEIRSRNFYISQ